MGGGTSNQDATPWGWSLEDTNKAIFAFDKLSQVLQPPDCPPTSWEGEIRGKEGSLTAILRLVVEHKYKIGSTAPSLIAFNMGFIKKPVHEFLNRQDVRSLIETGSDEGLRLRNKDVNPAFRKNILQEMAKLEKKIKNHLIRIEEFFDPPEE
jgi:hypothetical protein